MFKLLTPKQCSCGKLHKAVKYPLILGKANGYLWFNCTCNSTLVINLELTKEIL